MTLGTHHETSHNGGGSYTTTVHASPIAYDDGGIMRRIVNELDVNLGGDRPVGKVGLLDFRLADRLAGQSPVVHIGKGRSRVRFTPLGTNNVNGVVSGNGITYLGAWNNADLRILNGGHIIRKEVLLNDGHAASYSFRLDEHSGDGLRILPPSLENPETGDFIPLEWVIARQGQSQILTANLPAGDFSGWILDPTTVIQPSATAGKDSYMKAGQSTTNFGTDTTLRMGNPGFGAFTERPLAQYDLSGITGTIIAATWSFYMNSENSSNASTLRLYRLRSGRDWVESQVTWDEYKASTAWTSGGASDTTTDRESTVLGSLVLAAAPTLNQFYDVTLTASLVEEWRNGMITNNGFVGICQRDSDGLERLNQYTGYSSDHTTASERPKLTITFTAFTAPMFSTNGIHSAVFGGQVIRG